MKPSNWILKGAAAFLLVLCATAPADLLARKPAADTAADPATGTAASPYQRTLSFNGMDYHLRWSDRKEHVIILEYTPAGQEDLSNWQDMLTVQVFPQFRGGDQLADYANNLLATYQQNGAVILDTSSTPITEAQEARHYVVAVLQADNVVESNVLQMRLHQGQAMTIIAAHRFYGEDRIENMSPWIIANAGPIRQSLINWNPQITY